MKGPHVICIDHHTYAAALAGLESKIRRHAGTVLGAKFETARAELKAALHSAIESDTSLPGLMRKQA